MKFGTGLKTVIFGWEGNCAPVGLPPRADSLQTAIGCGQNSCIKFVLCVRRQEEEQRLAEELEQKRREEEELRLAEEARRLEHERYLIAVEEQERKRREEEERLEIERQEVGIIFCYADIIST